MPDHFDHMNIPLDEAWDFRLGDQDSWSAIQVPGCWEVQGYDMRTDGPAWYRKDFIIPREYGQHKSVLHFDAVSYACAVYLNGQEVGLHRGMWTPFDIDISSVVKFGENNRLELEVFKPGMQPGSRYPFRSTIAGFIPDVASTFGGIWQPVWISFYEYELSGVDISADYDARSIQTRCQLGYAINEPQPAEWQVTIFSPKGSLLISDRVLYQPGQPLDRLFQFPGISTWSPNTPNLYTVQIQLLKAGERLAHIEKQVGFRKLSAHQGQLLLNERPFLARGVLSWGWDPQTLAPYPSSGVYSEVRQVREMGFNCIKLCLFVPNPSYFQQADREGVLLWQELPLWLPEVIADLRTRAPLEYAEITRLCAGHPSLALFSLGCEMNRSVDASLIDALNEAVRGQLKGALLCENSGSGESYGGIDSDDSDFKDYHPYYDLQYFEPLLNHWRRDWQPNRPWIFGEFSDSDTFRDLNLIIRENGGETPWWTTPNNPVTDWRSEAQALLDEPNRLAAARLAHSAEEITRVSYEQAFTIRKYTLETLRRRAGMGGYVITGIRDTPISTSGVWDDLGKSKWGAARTVEINGEDILCLETDRRRTWRHGGDRPDPIEPYAAYAGDQARWQVIAHCSRRKIFPEAQLKWRLENTKNETLASGSQLIDKAVPAGGPVNIGVISLRLPADLQAQILRLRVELKDRDVPGMDDQKQRRNSKRRTPPRVISNCWNIWVFPPPENKLDDCALVDPTGSLPGWGDPLAGLPLLSSTRDLSGRSLVITTIWDTALEDWVIKGGKALLLQQGLLPLPARNLPFWREAIKLFEPHPIWQNFPHQGFTDLQFFGIAGDLAFDTSRLASTLPAGTELTPILRRLDAREFHVADYLLEITLGRGRMLACSLRLQGGSGSQPAGLRRNLAGAALLHAMLGYLT